MLLVFKHNGTKMDVGSALSGTSPRNGWAVVFFSVEKHIKIVFKLRSGYIICKQ